MVIYNHVELCDAQPCVTGAPMTLRPPDGIGRDAQPGALVIGRQGYNHHT